MLAKPFEPPKKKASMALKVAEKKDEREEQKESAARDTVIAAGRRESVKKGRCEQRKKCDADAVARLVANLARSRAFGIRHAGQVSGAIWQRLRAARAALHATVFEEGDEGFVEAVRRTASPLGTVMQLGVERRHGKLQRLHAVPAMDLDRTLFVRELRDAGTRPFVDADLLGTAEAHDHFDGALLGAEFESSFGHCIHAGCLTLELSGGCRVAPQFIRGLPC